jgi:hypothetical protein
VRDHHALVHHPPTITDLLDLGVDEHVRVAALQRPLAKRLHLLIQQRADPADLRPRHPQSQRLDELVDPPGRDAAHIGLLDDRDQRLLRALARLQKRREIPAPPQLGNLQLDLARPGIPPPLAIPIAVRGPILHPLAALGADQFTDLGLHQLLRDRAHRLADHIAMLLAQHPPDDLLDRHRPSPASLPSNLEKSDEQ